MEFGDDCGAQAQSIAIWTMDRFGTDWGAWVLWGLFGVITKNYKDRYRR